MLPSGTAIVDSETVIENGTLVVDGSRIEAVGRRGDRRDRYLNRESSSSTRVSTRTASPVLGSANSSAWPAIEAGLYPRTGTLGVGSDADIALVHETEYDVILAGGKIVARDHVVHASPVDGTLLPRDPAVNVHRTEGVGSRLPSAS